MFCLIFSWRPCVGVLVRGCGRVFVNFDFLFFFVLRFFFEFLVVGFSRVIFSVQNVFFVF